MRIATIVLAGVLLVNLMGAPATAADYFVSSDGKDTAAGTSAEQAWQTLARVGKVKLQPGDRVLLRRGDVWRESLQISGSGEKDKPITICAWGEGDKPRLYGSLNFKGKDRWKDEGGEVWSAGPINLRKNYFKMFRGTLWHDGVGGRQMFERADLAEAWQWWFDGKTSRVYVRLGHNPGQHDIEITRRFEQGQCIIGFVSGSYIRLEHLEIAYGDFGVGIWGGDGWQIVGCDFHDFTTDALHANGTDEDGPDNGLVKGCTFTDWNWNGYGMTHDIKTPWGSNEPFFGYGVHVFRAQGWRVEGCVFRFRHNRNEMDSTPIAFDDASHAALIADNLIDGAGRIGGSSTGVMLWAIRGKGPMVVRGNLIRNLGGMGIILQEFKRYDFNGDVTIENNRLENLCLDDRLDQEALRIWLKTDDAGRVTVRNNVIWKTQDGQHGHEAIRVRESRNVHVHNNTLVAADVGLSVERGSQVEAWNNLTAAMRQAACRVSKDSALREDHNGWHGKVEGFDPAARDMRDDPQLRDIKQGDLSLAGDSPAWQGGRDGGRLGAEKSLARPDFLPTGLSDMMKTP